MSRETALRWVAAVMLVFLMAGLTVIPSADRYHVDEQYYTDAALQMVATGDYLSPRTAEGELRFQKPIFTYWAVAAGFQLLGTSFAGARAFFLLAGALLLMASYGLASRLFKKREMAVGGLLVLAANHDVWAAAIRSTPDIWLALFTTLSFAGMAGLLFPEPASAIGTRDAGRIRRDSWIAWPAAGMAVAAKGLVGLLIPLWCLGFGAWRSRRGTAVASPRIIPLPALVGVGLATAWFIVMARTHGPGSLAQFYGDQIGTRTGAAALRMIQNAGWYLLVLPRDFLPWSMLVLLLLVSAPELGRRFWSRHREPLLFSAGWYGLLFLVFSGANVTKTRYFLPAAPLVAIALGAFLVDALSDPRAFVWRARGSLVIAISALAVGGVTMAVGRALAPSIVVAGILWMAGGLTAALVVRRASGVVGLGAVSVWLLLLLAGYDHLIRPVFGASPGRLFAERLAEVNAAGEDVVTLYVADRHLAQIRVHSKGRIWPRMAAGSEGDGTLRRWDGADPRARIILARETFRERLADRYEFQPCGWTYRRIRPTDVLAMMRRGRSTIEPKLRIPYFLGIRRGTAG